jgi:hypothetical protein
MINTWLNHASKLLVPSLSNLAYRVRGQKCALWARSWVTPGVLQSRLLLTMSTADISVLHYAEVVQLYPQDVYPI